MDLHVLHRDLVLVIDEEPGDRHLLLRDLLTDLSFVHAEARPAGASVIRLSVRTSTPPRALPQGGRVVLRDGTGLLGVRAGSDVYLSDGASLFHLQPPYSCGTAWLDPRFDSRPAETRQRFWALGLLTLLKQHGLFGLHAAAIAAPEGTNLLVAGPSGCGKSTLAIGVVRSGGRYLSDDAVLLRARADGVEVLALRRPFSIDAARAAEYPELVRERRRRDTGRKRRADPFGAYASQHMESFRPTALVFPTIASISRSTLREIPRSVALGHLLAQSGPDLFDPVTMPAHLSVLTGMLRRAVPYELTAGADLLRNPGAVVDLLPGGARTAWPGSSSN
jgi:hypothetical protein